MNKKELNKKIKELQNKADIALGKAEEKMDNAPLNNRQAYEAAHDKAYREYSKIMREIKLIEPIVYEDTPSYGDLMTIDSFEQCCKDGGFIDYDGYGNYATAFKMSNKTIRPSQVVNGTKLFNNPEFTHVVWFNK